MTNNIDRAAKIIHDHHDNCLDAANALADAGLLTPEAVAEVVRLRQAMTRLRDTYAAPDDPGDDYGSGMEAAYQIAADDLTRILEGESNE